VASWVSQNLLSSTLDIVGSSSIITILSAPPALIISLFPTGHITCGHNVEQYVGFTIQDDKQVSASGGLTVDVVALLTTTPLEPGTIPDRILRHFRRYLVGGDVFDVVFVPDEVLDVQDRISI
jgi:hypothetical protein